MGIKNLNAVIDEIVLRGLVSLNPSEHFLVALQIMTVSQKMQLLTRFLGEDADIYHKKIAAVLEEMMVAHREKGCVVVAGDGRYFWKYGSKVSKEFTNSIEATVDAYRNVCLTS